MSSLPRRRKPGTSRRVVSDPKPSTPAPASTALDGGSEPTRHSPCAAPPDAWQPDLSGIADLIIEGLRAHFPPFHPLRHRVGEIDGRRDGNGDYVETRERPADELVVKLFRELPIDEQIKALNGWCPNNLNIDYALLRKEPDYPLHPALQVDATFDATFDAHRVPFVSHTAMDAATFPVSVLIRVGAQKREVIDKLESLISVIDAHWDSMIACAEGGAA